MPTSVPPNVVISNVYADDNRGGAAITSAAVRLARTALPGCAVTLVSTARTSQLAHEALPFTLADHPDVVIVQAPVGPSQRTLGGLSAVLRSLGILAFPRWAGARNPAVQAVLSADLVIGKGGQVFRGYPARGLASLWLTAFPLVLSWRCRRPRAALAVSVVHSGTTAGHRCSAPGFCDGSTSCSSADQSQRSWRRIWASSHGGFSRYPTASLRWKRRHRPRLMPHARGSGCQVSDSPQSR